MYIQTKGHGKSQLEAAVYKLRKETSSKPNCIAILILDFQLLELCENKLLFYKPSICGFFFYGSLSKQIQTASMASSYQITVASPTPPLSHNHIKQKLYSDIVKCFLGDKVFQIEKHCLRHNQQQEQQQQKSHEDYSLLKLRFGVDTPGIM
jgi:hypothetical protein